MKRILILTNSSTGFYHFRKELIVSLINQKYEVFLSVPFGIFIDELKEMGCTVINTPVDRRGTDPLTDLKLIIRYNNLLKTLKPDLVLTYTVKPHIYGGLFCRLRNIPYIVNITGMGSTINNKGIIKSIVLSWLKISLRRASCVFFQNEMNLHYFLNNRIVATKHQLIPGSGVNLSEYCLEEYPTGEIVRFLFVGRVMREKGIELYLQTARTLKSRYSNIEFHVVGSCEEGYEEELSWLEDQGIIVFHGYRKNVYDFYKDCHALILPSYHEGMSNVLLEAASCGRPVIASNIAGCRECFDDGVSGYSIEVGNTTDLIDKVEIFLRLSQEQRKQMGLAGRAKVEREFDRRYVLDKYLDEIRTVLLNEEADAEEIFIER